MDYKKIVIILLICAALFLMVVTGISLSGCSSGDSTTVVMEKSEEDKIQIGVSIDSLLIERWSRERDIFASKAQELGAEVNIQNANGEIEEQIKQIQYFIDKEVDVIVVIAIDDLALTDILTKAKKQGIKIIAYDRLIRNVNVDLYISIDNERVGELMAQSI